MAKNKLPKLTMADISERVRGVVLDSQMPMAHEISVILGCSNISDELMEKEEDQSDVRVEKLSYLVPLMYAFSRLLAEGAVEVQKTSGGEELKAIPEDVWREGRKMMEQSSFAALLGTISQLVDMGLLEIPRKYK